MRSPLPEIICIDCGGTAHLITPPREDNSWVVGEFVAYRCGDCLDRWDLQLEEEDLVAFENVIQTENPDR